MRENLWSGILTAAFYILALAVLPWVVVFKLSPRIVAYVSHVGIDLGEILCMTTISGVLLAVLSLIYRLHPRGSLASLGAGIGSTLVSLYLEIFVLSFGKPSALGRVTLRQSMEGTEATLLMDFRGIILILAIGAILSAGYHVITFWTSRKEMRGPPKSQLEAGT